jgi:hypothetical protein
LAAALAAFFSSYLLFSVVMVMHGLRLHMVVVVVVVAFHLTPWL